VIPERIIFVSRGITVIRKLCETATQRPCSSSGVLNASADPVALGVMSTRDTRNTYRIIIFVVDSIGLYSVLLIEGCILDPCYAIWEQLR